MAQGVVFIRQLATNSITAFIILLLAGCSSSGAEGASSPKELMDKAVKSVVEDDYASFLKLIPPADRKDFVTQGVSLAMMPLMMMSRTFPSEGLTKTLDEFTRDLNLDEDDQRTPGEITLPRGADLEHAFVAAMRLQQDARIVENKENGVVTRKWVKLRETSFYYLASATNIEIKKIDGSTSVADVTFPLVRQRTEKTLSVYMVKKKGVWYLKMSPPLWPWTNPYQ